MSRANGFLGLPERAPKPREQALTHVMDKGLSLTQIEGLFSTAGDYIDIVKLGWGTSYVTGNLAEKLALYRSYGAPVVCGGTLLEAAEAIGRLDPYRSWLTENGFDCVEVSDGTIEMPRERKLEIIDMLSRDFRVLSEVGSKDAEAVFAPYQWVAWIKEERAAGADQDAVHDLAMRDPPLGQRVLEVQPSAAALPAQQPRADDRVRDQQQNRP